MIRFHESARLRGLRAGDDWSELINALRSQLQAVQLDQLRILTDAKDWKGAFELASRLMEKYGKEGEFQVEVARLLAANAGRVVTREEILDTLWGVDYVAESNVVDRQIRNLRARLQNDWKSPRFIATIPGRGYRFVPTFTEHAAEAASR